MEAVSSRSPLRSSRWHRYCAVAIAVCMVVMLTLGSTPAHVQVYNAAGYRVDYTTAHGEMIGNDNGANGRSMLTAASPPQQITILHRLRRVLGLSSSSSSSSASSSSGSSSSTPVIASQSSVIDTDVIPAPSWVLRDLPMTCIPQSIPFTIFVVATSSNGASLLRLFTALQAADYTGDCIALTISIDYPVDGIETKEHLEVVDMANAVQWYHGPKEVRVHSDRQGGMRHFIHVWLPLGDDETGIIFMDHHEPSPLYYRWWKMMYTRYGHMEQILGIAMQRPSMIADTEYHDEPLIVDNDFKPFLYSMPADVGFAPIAHQWREFRKWYSSLSATFQPITNGLVTNDQWRASVANGKVGRDADMWLQHVVYWTNNNAKYTLYTNLASSKTLCTSWLVSAAVTEYADAQRITKWNELDVMPDMLHMIGFDGKMTGELFATPPPPPITHDDANDQLFAPMDAPF